MTHLNQVSRIFESRHNSKRAPSKKFLHNGWQWQFRSINSQKWPIDLIATKWPILSSYIDKKLWRAFQTFESFQENNWGEIEVLGKKIQLREKIFTWTIKFYWFLSHSLSLSLSLWLPLSRSEKIFQEKTNFEEKPISAPTWLGEAKIGALTFSWKTKYSVTGLSGQPCTVIQ